MNLWVVLIIILFFVVRSVIKANEQAKKNQRAQQTGDPGYEEDVFNGAPRKEIDWEDLFSPREEPVPQPVKMETPKPKSAQKQATVKSESRPDISPKVSDQKKALPMKNIEDEESAENPAEWLEDENDVRKAVISAEILARKF